MKQVIRPIVSFLFIAALWFDIGYKFGFDKGQKYEQQEILKRIEIVDSIHKKDSLQMMINKHE